MADPDQRPLRDTPVTARILRTQRHDNRLGAVLASLHAFWTARLASLERFGSRRDAYSMVLFHRQAEVVLQNDTTSTPDELLNCALRYSPSGGTNFMHALGEARTCIESNWDADR